MKFKVGDVVCPKARLLRVRAIDGKGVWTGSDPSFMWWDCYDPKNLVFLYRRKKARRVK